METVCCIMSVVFVVPSPTRLEGMETRRRYGKLQQNNESPTRLEGMETFKNLEKPEVYKMSPTRLEGMETT